MKIPTDIEDGQNFFEKAESEKNPKLKIRYLEDAIDILNSYSEDFPDDIKNINKIKNLKVSYTRRLLVQLTTLNDIEVDDWLHYLRVFIIKLGNEIKEVTKNDPNLNFNLSKFKDIWKVELREAAKELNLI